MPEIGIAENDSDRATAGRGGPQRGGFCIVYNSLLVCLVGAFATELPQLFRSNNIDMAPRILILLTFSLAFIANAHAWGTQGHQAVAMAAEQQLTPRAREQVEKLLALDPGATMSSISTWADETRNGTTGSWHYLNFPRNTCTYVAARDCPDGDCVVDAINRQLEVLGSSAPDDKRLIALKYLVHLVADVHQPLHAGYADDRGGNRYQLQAFGRGTNLHALWDTGLIENMGLTNEVLAAKLASASAVGVDLDMGLAAEESCKIVAADGFYSSRRLDDGYVARYTPVVIQRLAVASARLVGLLNRILR